jgi:spermidine synthase
MRLALALAFVSGFISLSHEIAWYRVYSFAAGGGAEAFALMLCGYLMGIALGALLARSLCGEDGAGRGRVLGAASALFGAAALAFLVPPVIAAFLVRVDVWQLTLPLVIACAALLGAVFPLVAHAAVAPDERSGARFSYVYLANILGAALGSLATGFWLLDRWPLSRVSLFLALLSLAAGAALALRGERRFATPAGFAAAAALCVALADPLYGSLYERLQFKTGYRPGEAFAYVIENRSGVITVTAQGVVYGGGVYDGAYNVSPVDDVNGIVRAYALAALHPRPRKVLMIGLSTGSWATAVAEHPALEELTIVEINPGYLELLPRFAAVAHLPRHPRVKIEIDDGRRWLLRHPERRFDAVIVNGTMHWRANASNLLSREFTELVRSRLEPGGLYFFNATGSMRAAQTAARAFRHVAGINNCIAASDAPLELDLERWKQVMAGYAIDGERVIAGDDAARRRTLERLAAVLRTREYTPEAALRARAAGAQPITDDNMGSEWGE